MPSYNELQSATGISGESVNSGQPTDRLVIPSQAPQGEGVDYTAGTHIEGEEIVQPTNPKEAAKAAVGCITVWS